MAEDSWNDRAEAWAEHWPRLSEPARRAVADAAGVGAGMRLLDAGCGSGEFAALAVSHGATVSGIDASPGMLAVARRRAPEADLRVGDIAALPWDDDAFDLVTAFNAVQFTDDVPATIAELARVAPRVAICVWADGSELRLVFAALSGASSPLLDLEPAVRAAGLSLETVADVATPYETPDLATFVTALREASGIEGDVEGVAAPYRRDDGSYRFENTFRYVVATRS